MQDSLDKALDSLMQDIEIPHYPPALQEQEARLALARVGSEMVRPLMEAVAKLLTGNVEALNQITDALEMQNERMAALERVVKRRLPVTTQQVRYLNEAIRNRTHSLLDGKDGIDNKAYVKLGRLIRRDVQVRCGIAKLQEMPDHEYSVSMDQIRMWLNAPVLMDVIREARERVDALESAEQSAGVDGV